MGECSEIREGFIGKGLYLDTAESRCQFLKIFAFISVEKTVIRITQHDKSKVDRFKTNTCFRETTNPVEDFQENSLDTTCKGWQ